MVGVASEKVTVVSTSLETSTEPQNTFIDSVGSQMDVEPLSQFQEEFDDDLFNTSTTSDFLDIHEELEGDGVIVERTAEAALVGAVHAVAGDSSIPHNIGLPHVPLIPTGHSTNKNHKDLTFATAGNPVEKKVMASRRGPSSQKIWMLRNDFEIAVDNGEDTDGSRGSKDDFYNAAGDILCNPKEGLAKWVTASYTDCVAREREERILRRLAGQMDIPLSSRAYRQSTDFVNKTDDIAADDGIDVNGEWGAVDFLEGPDSGSKSPRLASPVMHQNFDKVTGLAIPALYDDTITITGAFLLEKVKRSKRQRGFVLQGNSSNQQANRSGGIFNGAYLNAHTAITNHCTETYWTRHEQRPGENLPPGFEAGAYPPAETSRGPGRQKLSTHPPPATGFAHTMPLCMFDYLKVGGGSTAGMHGKGNMQMYPAPNMNYLKKHAFITVLQGADGPMPVAPALPESIPGQMPELPRTSINTPVTFPDLGLRTIDMPWFAVAREFTYLPIDELFPEVSGATSGQGNDEDNDGDSDVKRQRRDSGNEQQEKEKSRPGPKTYKKRKREEHRPNSDLFFEDKDKVNDRAVTELAVPIIDITKTIKNTTWELAAPLFQEIVPVDEITRGKEQDNSSHAQSGSSSDSSNSGSGSNSGSSSGGSSDDNVNSSSDNDNSSGDGALSAGAQPKEAFSSSSSDGTAGESDEEDISDDAVSARHERVLKNMREKWALMQKLKFETKRDSKECGVSYGGGYGGYIQQAVSGSVDEGGFAMDYGDMRRRGRPPKINKFAVMQAHPSASPQTGFNRGLGSPFKSNQPYKKGGRGRGRGRGGSLMQSHASFPASEPKLGSTSIYHATGVGGPVAGTAPFPSSSPSSSSLLPVPSSAEAIGDGEASACASSSGAEGLVNAGSKSASDAQTVGSDNAMEQTRAGGE